MTDKSSCSHWERFGTISAEQHNINFCSDCTGATFETEQKPIRYSVNMASTACILLFFDSAVSRKEKVCCKINVHINHPDSAFKATSPTQRFLTFRCVPCVKIKNTDTFYPLKMVRNSRDGNYSFEFCPLHAAHA